MTAHQLRSRNWFGRNDLDGFVHRSWLKAEGFSDAVFDGRPVVGIANSWSELTNCNAHLCPDGAVLKQSAASPHLLTHRGRAVVFEDHADLHKRIDDERVAIDENSVLVLKHVGPRGAPGMPEWGAAPIPARLLKRGVKDMVRISDARMSGTSYGTVVLHVAPESAIGGPLALVRDGDEIELDVPRRSLTLKVSDEELARRRAAWKPRPPHFTRGYGKLFLDHVLQANEGVDFDYLKGRTPVRFEDTAGPSHS